MGLDISYYRNIKKTDAVFDEDRNPIDPHTREILDDVYIPSLNHPIFRDRSDGVEEGVYEYDFCGSFRVGSYSGYNHWREELAKGGGYPKYADSYAEGAWNHYDNGPFWELINFSDCEGFIGPKTSLKLFKDFEKYEKEFEPHNEYFKKIYDNFKEAFKVASENGVVDFH